MRVLESKYVVARRQNSEGYPGVTQYYLSWSPVPNVTEYILNWCQDSASCDENRFETWRFPGSQDNALICIPKDKVMFYVSVCRGDQCGPMASAKLDIGYGKWMEILEILGDRLEELAWFQIGLRSWYRAHRSWIKLPRRYA